MPTRPRYDTYLTKGDCFDFSLTYAAAGVVVNLTGYTAEMSIQYTFERGLGRVKVTDSLLLTGDIVAAEGKISFHATAAQTDAMPKISQAEYQIRITDPSGCVTTLLSGNLSIFKNNFEDA
ncbi:hypothetical protein [Rhizobium rhizogenes]|uniref:hypothetical protein n=1 Tax=Rhizobium rhizogenes TaxID=359 RepID=UPI0004D448D5|nr:hypothetical protein [Rhizobium rhizogenes]KEA07469.1 hypothetical protein CN09_11195 [Rhizobium rhizogenes]NTJ22261.1 hypothetical protein [Rhizobium rhizogenes]QUE80978.1 hypothetical protein EML492_03980 [Rhizobium rhizogenes]TQO80916.1 hypothetical protein FFE80_07420 [Rhizobium rhizogenes]TRB51510.1 hypothetical protein EXN69_26305 [Rhizobium rhizogenes]